MSSHSNDIYSITSLKRPPDQRPPLINDRNSRDGCQSLNNSLREATTSLTRFPDAHERPVALSKATTSHEISSNGRFIVPHVDSKLSTTPAKFERYIGKQVDMCSLAGACMVIASGSDINKNIKSKIHGRIVHI